MTGMVQGRAQLQTVTIGGDRDGNVRAYRLDVLQDAGAYPRLGAVLPMFTRMMAPAVYDIERVESRARVLVTNTTSVAAYRGAGRPEATAAIERAMDLFAAEIGMDPAEVRRRNLLRPDQFPLTTKGGAPYDSGEYEKALDKVLDAVGYADLRAEQAARRERGDAVQIGIGVSVFVEITGGGAFKESAAVEVHPDGTVTVLTGTSPARPGARHGLGDARERAPRHPGREDHRQARRHRPRPPRLRHHGLAEPADRRRGRLPGGGRAGGGGQAAGGRPAGGERRRPRGGAGRGRRARHGHRRVAGRPRRAREAARRHPVRLGGADVPVRRARRRRARRRGVGQGGHRQDRHHRRRGPRPQPPHRRGAAARRHRAGHRAGVAGGGRLRRGRQPGHRHVRRLRHPVRGGAAQLHAARHGHADPPQPVGGQGDRRGGHHRRHPGGAERGDRRARAPRGAPHRHAADPAAGVGSDRGRAERRRIAHEGAK